MQATKSNGFYLGLTLLFISLLALYGCGRNMELGMTNDQQTSSGKGKRPLPTPPSSPESKRPRIESEEEQGFLAPSSSSTLPGGQSSSSVHCPIERSYLVQQEGSAFEPFAGATPNPLTSENTENPPERSSQVSLDPETGAYETASLAGRNKALTDAAAQGDYATVKALLEDPTVKVTAKVAVAIAEPALAQGHIEIAKLLVGKKAVKSPFLWMAAAHGSLELVHLILNSPFTDIDIQDQKGYTALMWAVEGGHKEVVQALLDFGANVALGDYPKYMVGRDGGAVTPLTLAAKKGSIEVSKQILTAEIALKKQEEQARENAEGSLEEQQIRESDEGNIEEEEVEESDEDSIEEESLAERLTKREQRWKSAFMQALKQGHTEIAKQLIENGLSKDFAIRNAAYQGNVELVQLLLDNGVYPDAGIDEVPKILNYVGGVCVSKEPRPDAGVYERHTPLLEALEGLGSYPSKEKIEKHKKVVQLLIDRGAFLRVTNGQGANVLMLAAEHGLMNLLYSLFNQENTRELKRARDKHGATAFHYAARGKGTAEQKKELFELLASCGEDFRVADDQGRTPLGYAIQKSERELIEKLIELGALTNPDGTPNPDIVGKHLIEVATYMNEQDYGLALVQLFFDHNANVNAQGKDGMTALICAAKYQKPNMLRALLAHSADPELKDRYGRNALMWAARQGADEVVASLLREGAKVDATDNQEKTALHQAIDCFTSKYSYTWSCVTPRKTTPWGNVIQLLLDREGVAIQPSELNKALLLATKGGCLELVPQLLDKGADMNAVDDTGNTPLCWIINQLGRALGESGGQMNQQVYPFHRTANLLLARGARIDIPNRAGKSLLMLCIEVGTLGTAKYLVEAVREIQTAEANKALLLAIKKGDLALVQLLLDKGASAHAVDDEGKTALQCAGDNHEIAALLRQRGAQG